jgi:hypothetical protein
MKQLLLGLCAAGALAVSSAPAQAQNWNRGAPQYRGWDQRYYSPGWRYYNPGYSYRYYSSPYSYGNRYYGYPYSGYYSPYYYGPSYGYGVSTPGFSFWYGR